MIFVGGYYSPDALLGPSTADWCFDDAYHI